MAHIQLTFDNMNTSLQVGDNAYYSHSGVNTGGFDNTALANTNLIGPVIGIMNNVFAIPPLPGWTITVNHNSNAPAPAFGSYISFAKDKKVNTSSLLGYYASVNFVNNSTNKVELFSVGSEISESSK